MSCPRTTEGTAQHFPVSTYQWHHASPAYQGLYQTFALWSRLFAFPMPCHSYRQVKPVYGVSRLDRTLTCCIDLKLDNIMLTFEDPTVIDKFAQAATSDSPPHRKVAKEGRTVYQSQNNFGGIRESQTGLLPKITDFGLARLGDDVLKILREPIQAPVYHAPEVILGTGWSYSADIWNLGVLVRFFPLPRNFDNNRPNRAACCRFGT